MALQRWRGEGESNYAYGPALPVREGGPWLRGPSLSTQMPDGATTRLVHYLCFQFQILPANRSPSHTVHIRRHIPGYAVQTHTDLNTNMRKAQLSIHLRKHKLAKTSITTMVCRKDVGNAYCFELFNPQPKFPVIRNNWELANFKKM